MKTQRQIALDAAAALKEVGWCQNSFRMWDHMTDELVGYCAVGAIRHAAGFYTPEADLDDNKARLAAALAGEVVQKIDSLMPVLEPDLYAKWSIELGSPLVHYNDTRYRTKEEIIKLFEAAALMLPNTEAGADNEIKEA